MNAFNPLDYLTASLFSFTAVHPTSPRAKGETVAFMDSQLDLEEGMCRFMTVLCRSGDDDTRKRARFLVYSVFLNNLNRRRGSVVRLYGDDSTIVSDAWWVFEQPMGFFAIIEFVYLFLTDIFWRGLRATGFRKMIQGIKTWMFTLITVPKKDGREVPYIDLNNLAVCESRRGQGIGTAQMKIGCHAADRLGVPIRLQVADDELIAFYERFGFVDMGQIPNLPEAIGYYHWMVRWPKSVA